MQDHERPQWTIFNLIACIIHEVTRPNLFQVSRMQLSMTEEKIISDQSTFAPFYQSIASALDEHIEIPQMTFSDVLKEVRKRIQRNDFGSIGLLLQLLDQAVGPFKEIFPKMGYRQKSWQHIAEIPPLNSNHQEFGIKLYPIVYPFWTVEKSSFFRSETPASLMKNYFALIAEENCVSLRFSYMLGSAFQQEFERQGSLSIALSPLSNSVHMTADKVEEDGRKLLKITGLQNPDFVASRLMKTFCQALDDGCHLIAFPEAIGSRGIVSQMQNEMRRRSGQNTLVLPPTFYEDGRNKAVLLGPGGCIIHEQDKIIPFTLHTDGSYRQEQLISENRLNVLLVEGLGGIVTPICRDFLENNYNNLFYGTLPVHTILIPSFTPGKTAFDAAMAKGQGTCSLSMWVNTCTAQTSNLFDHTYDFETVATLVSPFNQPSARRIDCQRKCQGVCSHSLCYFHIILDYNQLTAKCTHKTA